MPVNYLGTAILFNVTKSVSKTIVNPWIYDVLVITEKSIEDTAPAPNKPVGEALLPEQFGMHNFLIFLFLFFPPKK
jgi:hypothetical protein